MSGDPPLYLGLTGTKLNIWVTVACTTAMTLFGEQEKWRIYLISERDLAQVTIRVSLVE